MLGACVAIVLFFSLDVAAQCAMCRTALTQSAEGQRWSRGINAGILLLLAAPFLIAGSALLVIYPALVQRWLQRLLARVMGTEVYRKARLLVPPVFDR